ncbi:biotin-dependent carboxyltransferase family protein [Leisingera sp. JC1]|uniref:5-oxoprolinase subunit C family protein n=1 Tax=Leisingera sp. JC1 TaxID=1855282 RepID=UPI000802AF97|nr:urea amidolyase [Leisingera sp. JC1]OBY26695.1 urea amidolyase [Leisingera sp. JC1]
MSGLKILRVGPAASVQDMGRPGLLGQGISQGGAADTLALAEGAALLRQDPGLAALEMGGMGGEFEATGPLRIALTGAPMAAALDGAALTWNASHRMESGQRLTIGAARAGVYGYLHLGGGIATEPVLGARAVHLMAGLGRAAEAGDLLPAGPDPNSETGLVLVAEDRFKGGELRIVESFQSHLFPEAVRARFAAEGQLNILSEVILPGDVQMTGDGKPFVLLRECQTTGGYPRIGTVLPCDLPKAAQAQAGAPLRFRWVSLEDGLEIQSRFRKSLKGLPAACRPLVRDPAAIRDLLSYQLISGAVSAGADPFAKGETA